MNLKTMKKLTLQTNIKDMDLICTVCICPRVYVLYIGSVNFPASAVSKHFEAEDRKRLGR